MVRRFFQICFLILCIGLIKVSAQTGGPCGDYDVYLLIGQSNMAGRGYLEDGDEQVIDRNVFILDDKGEVVPATNPLNQYSSIRKMEKQQGVGPGLGFARRLAEKSGRKILLVVNARGGTTMDQWTKGESGEGYYEEAVRRTRQALKYGPLKAIVWHQGCGDSRKTDVYMAKLSSFVASLRSDLDADVPFIAGELGQWRSVTADFNAMIRTISDHIPDSDWVSSKGCQPIGTPRSNGKPDLKDAHFDRKSQIILGRRYADKVLRMCY